MPLEIGNRPVLVAPHSFGRYRFCLLHEHGRVGITPSGHLPAIRVQPRSQFLHSVGPLQAVEHFHELLESAVGPIRFTVARLDLYADFQGWKLTGDDRQLFVVRGRGRDTYEDGHELTGFVFGRRKTNNRTSPR